MAESESAGTSLLGDERSVAVRLFNETWELLERGDRTAREDDRLIHLAHASRFHWDNVGTNQNRAIGEWQVSRVYAALGLGDRAVHHARRAVEYASEDGTDDWVAASALEGLARAHATAGDLDQAIAARARALDLLASIADDDDRGTVQSNIDSLPF